MKKRRQTWVLVPHTPSQQHQWTDSQLLVTEINPASFQGQPPKRSSPAQLRGLPTNRRVSTLCSVIIRAGHQTIHTLSLRRALNEEKWVHTTRAEAGDHSMHRT